MILASNRGTLMELGISPIVTSGAHVMFLMIFLQGTSRTWFDQHLVPNRVREVGQPFKSIVWC